MKLFLIKMNSSGDQALTLDKLKTQGAEVIQTSDGLLVKSDQSLSGLENIIGSGTVTIFDSKKAQEDPQTPKDVRVFAGLLGLFLMLIQTVSASSGAHYKVLSGTLHRKGEVIVHILPDTEHFKVQLDYDVKKKTGVPVPSKLLKGRSVYEFPQKFRTEEGYKHLQKVHHMDTPKATLVFQKHEAGVYFIEILPKNKKSKIETIYDPKIPMVGWSRIKITFLSPIPVLNGYRIEAEYHP